MIEYPHISASEALGTEVLSSKGVDLDPKKTMAEKGQIIILFALFLTAMLGVLGLSIDVGYSASQRRAMQSAADLAAQSGALAVANYSDSNELAAATSIDQTLSGNRTHEGSAALVSCSYINDALTNVGSCDSFVPSVATGVLVDVSETHRTFFLRAIPGGPEQVTTSAKAAARVERLFRAGMDSPFIVCGYDTKRMDGSEMSILTTNDVVNQSALGQTFRFTGAGDTISRCGLSGSGASGWRGLAKNQFSAPNNTGKEINMTWWGQVGISPGALKADVTGVNGCKVGLAAPYGNCVMEVPIAVDGAHGFPAIKPLGGDPSFYVTKVLGFLVTSCGSGCYQGTLIDDYPTFGASVGGWSRDSGAVVVIKLKE